MKARVILSACNSAAILSRSQKMKSAEEMDHLEVGPVLVSVQESICTASSTWSVRQVCCAQCRSSTALLLGHVCAGSVGLDLRGWFQPKWFCDSFPGWKGSCAHPRRCLLARLTFCSFGKRICTGAPREEKNGRKLNFNSDSHLHKLKGPCSLQQSPAPQICITLPQKQELQLPLREGKQHLRQWASKRFPKSTFTDHHCAISQGGSRCWGSSLTLCSSKDELKLNHMTEQYPDTPWILTGLVAWPLPLKPVNGHQVRISWKITSKERLVQRLLRYCAHVFMF